MSEKLESNKLNAIAFYELAFNKCEPERAVSRYVGERYLQHNPRVPDGKSGFIEYMERMSRDYPGKRVEIKRAVAQGEYVVLHCYQHWPNDHDYACVDIFRFDDAGKIVEHWDVLQALPSDPENDNSMF